MHRRLAALVSALLFTVVLPAGAEPGAADPMPLLQAREVIGKTIELVEREGVYPRNQAEYDLAKAALLKVVADGAGQPDRKEVQARIRTLLATLDADGHSFLMPAAQAQQNGRPAGMQRDDLRPPAFRLVTTRRGTVLRWTPAAIRRSSGGAINDYVKGFYDEAAARSDIKAACALVVDLSEQTGGNAWPPFVAMYPLFGDANQAMWVDRDGRRSPVVNRVTLEGMARPAAAGRDNPLAPYAGAPLAVVVGGRTASAGEMLLVALLGEQRVQTFGQTSYGLSTGNKTHALPDGSTLVLTGMRYALGDGPVYRGGIPAMHPSEKGEPVDAAVKTAAEWAAAHSPACGPVPGGI